MKDNTKKIQLNDTSDDEEQVHEKKRKINPKETNFSYSIINTKSLQQGRQKSNITGISLDNEEDKKINFLIYQFMNKIFDTIIIILEIIVKFIKS